MTKQRAKQNENRVEQVRDRVQRYGEEIGKLHEQVRHWAPEIDEGLQAAVDGLQKSRACLTAWPQDLVPSRKPPVRRYARIKVGDVVQVAERFQKRTPPAIRTARLTVTAVEGDLVMGQHGGVVFGVERRFLKPAPLPPSAGVA